MWRLLSERHSGVALTPSLPLKLGYSPSPGTHIVCGAFKRSRPMRARTRIGSRSNAASRRSSVRGASSSSRHRCCVDQSRGAAEGVNLGSACRCAGGRSCFQPWCASEACSGSVRALTEDSHEVYDAHLRLIDLQQGQERDHSIGNFMAISRVRKE